MENDNILRSMLEGIGDGEDEDEEKAEGISIGGAAFKLPGLSKKKRGKKPSRTVSATPGVVKMGEEQEQFAKDMIEKAKPHLKAIEVIVKEAIRRRHKFWSTVEVEMDLGEPMDLKYNPDSREIEIYDKEDEE